MTSRSPLLVLSLAILFALPLQAAELFAGLSLRIRDEAAPAGSIVQIKVDVTEPKPISTGKGTVKTGGIRTIEGIALMNGDRATYGLATVKNDELTFAIHSPSALFGTDADYPILTIAGVVDPSAANGATFPLTLGSGALQFADAAGAQYPLEIANGQLTVANVVAIGNVWPGSSVVPAGGVVHISGANFNPNTRIQLSEAAIAETRFLSSSRIDVVLAQTADMRGLRIRARNDKSEATYFSYQRTATSASSNETLSAIVPLFAANRYTEATLSVPASTSSSHGRRRAAGPSHGGPQQRGTFGVALQNIEESPLSATIELLDGAGHVYAVTTVAVAANQTLVRELGEWFGTVAAPAAVRVRSTTPLHILGIAADASGTATAVPPG